MRTAAFIVAIILGIVAAVGVRSYLKSQKVQHKQTQRLVEVAVARRSIRNGEVLTRDMLGLREEPASALHGLHIPFLELDRYVGRKVNRNIDRGTLILRSHFSPRLRERASGVVAEGKRALSINVDATSGVAGLITPGDSVDIMATMTVADPDARRGGAALKTWRVLSDVSVLAVDDRMSRSAVAYSGTAAYRRGYATLTLAVTPAEAEILVHLKEHAKLTFVLRSQSEVGEKESLPVVDAVNVMDLAAEANRKRQKEIQDLERVKAPAP